MAVKINDRTMVYVLFLVLAVLSLLTVQANRAAESAAKEAAQVSRLAVNAALEARDAATLAVSHNADQINSHRIHNQAEHKCLLIISNGELGSDALSRFDACVETASKGTTDPTPLDNK